MLSINTFFHEIKARKVLKTLTIYLSSGITILGVVNLFSNVYHFPPIIFDCVLTAVICGLPSAFIFSWNHTSGEKRKIRKSEIVVHTLAFAFALIIIIKLTGNPGASLLPRNSKSIAVLPFKNLSESKEDEYFSDGIMEDILTQLCKINDLRVISRTSVMQYKNTQKNLKQIGEELGVAVILEGSVRRIGNRVRIVGQLINARSDQHIWAETYDRDMKDVFAVQTEVAKNIASALEATLSPQELQQIEKKSTGNLDAYSFYLRGRDYYYNYSKEGNERAIGLFRKALELDPKYALAYAGLADAYGRKKYYEYSSQWNDSAMVLSNKALAIDPNLAEAHKALGDAYDSIDEPRIALMQYISAVKLNPNYAPAIANIGFTYYHLGSFDEALKWMKKAMTIEPGTARWSSNVGLQYFSLGFDSLATIWLNKALELQPEFFFPKVVLTYIDLYGKKIDTARDRINKLLAFYTNVPIIFTAAGDVELITRNYIQAKKFYEKAAELSSFRSEAGIKLAFVYLKLNQREKAKKILIMNIPASTEDMNNFKEGTGTYFTAAAACLDQQNQLAISLLKRSLEVGFRDYRWMSIDPLLSALRVNPEVISLTTTINNRINEMRKHVETENL